MIKIAKFGGSSVASAEQFKKVKAIVEADPAKRGRGVHPKVTLPPVEVEGDGVAPVSLIPRVELKGQEPGDLASLKSSHEAIDPHAQRA